MSTNEYWTKSDTWIVHCHKFSSDDFHFSQGFIVYVNENFPHIFKKNYAYLCTKMDSPQEVYELFLEMIFPSRHVTPKRPVPGSNNTIRFPTLFTKYLLISPCPCQVLTNWVSMVRGSWVMISFGFNVIFCIKKQFHMVLTWSDCLMDKCDI